MSDHLQRIGPHDLGGLPGEVIDRSEHDFTFWERRVDAMMYLLFKKGIAKDWSRVRHLIESLGPDIYEKLSYYERWAGAAGALLVEEGVISAQELEQRISELKSRAREQ